jgi:hypothetical protein
MFRKKKSSAMMPKNNKNCSRIVRLQVAVPHCSIIHYKIA